MPASPRVALIVGAGIGGLAAAVALRQSAWQVRVVERAAHPRELGFALLLASNALVSLRRLGVADRIAADGALVEFAQVHGRGGRLIRSFDTLPARARLPEPPRVALRQVLHGALLEAVGTENVTLGAAVTGFEDGDGRPVLLLQNGRRITGDVLIGADGVGSVIRRTLRPFEPPPRRSGLFAVRGLARNVESLMGDLSAAQYWGVGVEGGAARANARDVYWFLSIPARLVGGSRDPLGLARQLAAQFDGRFRGLVAATVPEDARLDELFDRDPVDPWGRGAVTLLGDAAHPMLPHAGQGAAQALEDAVALGAALAGDVDLNDALRRYEHVRAKRAGRLVLQSRRNARIASLDSRLGCWLRETLVRWIPEPVFARAYVQFGNPPEVP